MAVATGTLTVNAAFLQDIKEDNQRLRELLHHAEGMLSDVPGQEPLARRLVETLSELRDQLALHFTLEEAYGYFEDALEVAPQLGRQAEELRSQHQDLFVDLCGIVESAERWLYQEVSGEVLPRLAQRYRRFHKKLREHEARETEIIMEAMNDDVGVGD